MNNNEIQRAEQDRQASNLFSFWVNLAFEKGKQAQPTDQLTFAEDGISLVVGQFRKIFQEGG